MWVQCVLCDRYVEIDDERAIAKRFRKRPDYAYLCSRCGGGLAEAEREMLEPGKLPPELAALERSAAPSFASWSEPSKPRQGRRRGEEAGGAPPGAFAERSNGGKSGESRRPNSDTQRPASGGGPSRPGGDPGVPQNGKPQQGQVSEHAQGQGQPQAQGGGRQRRRGRSGKGSGQGASGPVGAPGQPTSQSQPGGNSQHSRQGNQGQPGSNGQQSSRGQPRPNGQARDNGRHRGHGRDRSRQKPAGAGPEPGPQPHKADSGRTGPSQPKRNQ